MPPHRSGRRLRRRHELIARSRRPFKQQDGVSTLDIMIRKSLYWPDGKCMRSKSCAMQRNNDQMCRLVQALVDKYNEDHHLLVDLVYEVKDVLSCNPISEDGSCYYHLNFIANSKAIDDSDNSISNIFFAEAKHLNRGRHSEVFVCCFCKVNPIDKGQHCNGCTILGEIDMKHPDSSAELAAGHLDPHTQFGGQMEAIKDHWIESEDRLFTLRCLGPCIDDPRVIERLFTLPPGVTIVRD
ncbi:hypothetical protein PAHAL_9G047000 [Panicum hallii]|uniref:DUF3615 domain-containing protein n=1 Tax=Panicum hallii TaxID=206008 RepID=A0A2T8I040_9POAL|nr:hypothetical protein PAHAL_9G047000 [Panicum hallii]